MIARPNPPTSLAAKQVCPGLVQRATCTDLLKKVELLLLSVLNNLWLPGTIIIIITFIYTAQIQLYSFQMRLTIKNYTNE